MAMAEEVIGSADYAEEWIEEDSQLARASLELALVLVDFFFFSPMLSHARHLSLQIPNMLGLYDNIVYNHFILRWNTRR